MTTPPTRCCAPATSGRCANTPAPFGQTRYIGPVEIAACNLPKHQDALKALPAFERRDGYCGAKGCCKVATSGLCIEHHNLYRRHGVLPRLLTATPEAPMSVASDPTPELPLCPPPTPEVSHVAVVPTPPTEPKESAGEGAKGGCTYFEGDPCVCYAVNSDCPHVTPGCTMGLPTPALPHGILDRATGPGTDGESDGETVDARHCEEGLRIHAESDAIHDAQEQLKAIAALLDADPERSPAWDDKDQPIPLVKRVEIAMMPSESQQVKDLRASFRGIERQLGDVDAALHALGSYGRTSTRERLLQVLPVEDRRALLELDAAELRASLARLKARRLNPPPPERVAEYAEKLARVEARIAALDHSPDAGKKVDG